VLPVVLYHSDHHVKLQYFSTSVKDCQGEDTSHVTRMQRCFEESNSTHPDESAEFLTLARGEYTITVGSWSDLPLRGHANWHIVRAWLFPLEPFRMNGGTSIVSVRFMTCYNTVV
jgi:hypothetical protein